MSDVVQYKFLSLVGEGGFGKVYRARMQVGEFSKDVAIKLLSDPDPPPSLLERFRDEAKILGLIRDRAIVGVEPPIQISERWAVIMEFVDGVSCGYLLGDGRLPAGVAVEIVGEVARALHSAFHQEGPEGEPLQLLHRDIKPENIQVTPSGDVRILDFGIARANFAAREFKTRHSLGGTPGYIAPERLNRVEVPEGDVFSLGVVLHELVTGDRPKHPPTVEVDTQIQHGDDDEEEVPFSGIVVDEDELEVPDDLRGDPMVMGVIRLAAWMRAYDPGTRPSSREVEEACRQFRLKLPPPFFRNWAESHVPHRMELDADDMVGRVLTTERSSGSPLVIGRPITEPGPPPVSTGGSGMAMGALVGSGVTLLVTLGGLAFVVAVALGLFVASDEGGEKIAEETPPRLEPARIDPLPPRAEPEEPAYLLDEEPEPAPVRPREPRPRRLAPSGTAEAPATPPVLRVDLGGTPEAPERQSDELPVREKPTGMLVLETIPPVARVMKSGRTLARTGLGYELDVGSHVVTVVSESGERTSFPVMIKAANHRVTVCYNFATNSRCGG